LWSKIKATVQSCDKENTPTNNKRKREEESQEEANKKAKVVDPNVLLLNRLALSSIISQNSSKPFRKKINTLFDKYKDTGKFIRKVREIFVTVENEHANEVVGKQATIMKMYVDQIVTL
jgi:hypothetical protein